MNTRSKPRLQCSKCPWKTTTDPFEIPGGYDPDKHAKIHCTIAMPGEFNMEKVRIMSCHEYTNAQRMPCVGWLKNQLGPGNNLGLRMLVSRFHIDCNVRAVGPQHEKFEDTLPEPMDT